MSTQPDDGGPAFPVPMVPCDNGGGYTEVRMDGLSLRDYFAAKALEALIAATPENQDYPSPDWCSERAYEYADALLSQRKKPEQGRKL